NTAVFVFVLGAVLVFMVLSAQYESWSLQGAIILIVPMCLLAAISGVWLVGSDNNIFTQVGLVVLIGLAAKNAILIVEFAKQLQDQGKSRFDAIIEATKTRLRPILMTSFAFISAPAPAVRTSGSTPRMKANEVMRIGRSRVFEASTIASKRGLPSSWSCFANSTIRIAFLAARPIRTTRPTCVKMLLSEPTSQTPLM